VGEHQGVDGGPVCQQALHHFPEGPVTDPGATFGAVGRDHHDEVGTVLGAVLGGSIGADIANKRRYQNGEVRYRTEEVCQTSYEVREEERLVAYNVSYVFGGSTYTTRMHRDPGDSIRVRVRVSPAQ